jgi:hypothetical protein
VASELAGADMSEFRDRHVRGAELLPLDGSFELLPE